MAPGIDRSALWEQVLPWIRERILSGEFAPGERLTETELADSLGTSRGPVREALRELARQHLVVELPRRGAIVSTLEDRDLSEVYAVREALEVQAARHLVTNATDSQINGLARHLDAFENSQRDYLERAEHDIAFHRALVALACNGRMVEIYEQMLGQTLLLLRTVAEQRSGLRTRMAPSVHRDILQALLSRDDLAAREALDRHYRHAVERLLSS